MSTSCSRFAIEAVKPEETDVLLRLYVDLFHDREPLTACLGFGKERMAAIVSAMHLGKHDALARKLHWMAKDHEAGGRAIGCIVCDDPADPDAEQLPPDLTEQELTIIPAVVAFLSAVRAPAGARISNQMGECLHVAAVGIAPGYEGAGLATRLLQTALSEARTRGFRHAFAECTGPASRRCHQKCGFASLHNVLGDVWAYNGTHPFAGYRIDCHLMWKDLSC